LQTLDALEDLGKLGKGASASHYFKCSDNRVYVVKLFEQPGNKTVANELLGFSLATELTLPVPNIVFVQIPQQLINLSEELRQRAITPRLHIGSERIENAFDFDNPMASNLPSSATIVNESDLPGVIVLDNWILNCDRNNLGNNLLQVIQSARFRYLMVDFSHCFTDPNWTEQTLIQNKLNTNMMPTFPFIGNMVRSADSFDESLSKLEGLPDGRIDSIVGMLPPDWKLTDGELQGMREFLKYREATVRNVLLDPKNRGNFPNWR